MKNLNLILVSFLIATLNFAYCQTKPINKEKISKLIVRYKEFNHFNQSDSLDINTQYFLIRESNISILGTMENIVGKLNTKSTGKIELMDTFFIPATEYAAENEILIFKWYYSNNYNEEEGIARVKLIKACDAIGKFFRMTIILENLDVIFYEGLQDETFNLNQEEKKECFLTN